jgi:hypothetical protein
MRTGIYEVKDWEAVTYEPGILNYQWCCDCNLRHVVQYNIAKRNGKSVVLVRTSRDDWATNARRRELRRKKRR